MILEAGNKVLVSHRRLFAQDEQRFFVGEVLGYDAGIVKLRGYSFVVDTIRGEVLRKEDARVKVIALHGGSLLVYQLCDTLSVEAVRFHFGEAALVMTDGTDVVMNLTDAPHGGTI